MKTFNKSVVGEKSMFEKIKKVIKNKYFNAILNLILVFLSVCSLKYMGGISVYKLSVSDVIIFTVLLYIVYQLKKQKIRITKLEIIFASISSVIFFIGKNIYEYHSLYPIRNAPFKSLCLFIGILFLIILFYTIFRQGLTKLKKNKLFKNNFKNIFEYKKTYIIMGLVLLLIYGICYLAYFPGSMSYDINGQLLQGTSDNPYTDHHPVLHTLFAQLIFNIGNHFYAENGGLILFSIIQMLIVISTCIYLIYWLNKNKVSNFICFISFLYFALVPSFHIFSFLPTKDVIFSCFLILFLISVLDLYKKETKITLIKCIILGLLSCLFRNNMVYALIVTFIIVLFTKERKKLWLMLLAIISSYFIVTKAIYPMCGVVSAGDREKLSVPILQIANVYNNSDVYTKNEKKVIKKYMKEVDTSFYVPNGGKYNIRFADTVKYSLDKKLYAKDSKTFWKLWFKGFREKPNLYLYTFLDLNIPYWYPNAVQPDPNSQRLYIEDLAGGALDDDSRGGRLYNIYHNIAHYNMSFMRLPLLNNFFALSFAFWSSVICLYIALLKPKKEYIIVLGILFMLLFTYLLGPVSIFRYVYSFYLALPLYLGVILNNYLRGSGKK